MKRSSGAPAPKKPATEKKLPSHPPAAEMVIAAIAALSERKGSSLQAIKSYIASTYNVVIDRQAIFIRKYIRGAVERKELLQTSGSGAMGRFKLVDKKNAMRDLKKKQQQAKEKKEKAEKKEKVEKKDKAEKLEKKVNQPTKEKKTGKALATKTKPPKPKKTTASAPKAT